MVDINCAVHYIVAEAGQKMASESATDEPAAVVAAIQEVDHDQESG
jgi:hypothetical protein